MLISLITIYYLPSVCFDSALLVSRPIYVYPIEEMLTHKRYKAMHSKCLLANRRKSNRLLQKKTGCKIMFINPLKVSAHVGTYRRDTSQRYVAATKSCVVHTEGTCSGDMQQQQNHNVYTRKKMKRVHVPGTCRSNTSPHVC